MLPYKAPLEDILFSLQSVAGAAALADVDIDTLSEIGTHFAALAENELAPLNAVSTTPKDRIPPLTAEPRKRLMKTAFH